MSIYKSVALRLFFISRYRRALLCVSIPYGVLRQTIDKHVSQVFSVSICHVSTGIQHE